MTWFDWVCVAFIIGILMLPLFSGLTPRGTPRIMRATQIHMRAIGGRLVECRVTETEKEDLSS